MKYRFRTVVSFVLALVVVASMFPVGVLAEGGTCGNNLTWTKENSVVTIRGSGAMYDYDAHRSETNAPWYSRSDFNTLIIENGVTSIGNYAFGWCMAIRYLTIPNSVVSIGEEAFGYCHGLSDVSIPSGVRSIGEWAFYRCDGLERVKLSNQMSAIPECAFGHCGKLSKVYIPVGIKSIEKGAFQANSRLSDIYYYGTASQWNAISIGADNDPLWSATIHYNYSPQHTVTFDPNGGYVNTTSKTVYDDSTYGSLPTPTRNGYSFVGWFTDSINGTQIDSSSTVDLASNQTLYAHWKISDTVKPTGSIGSTNAVASSQTVTLSLSDNVAVAGYYWGTSPTYSYNTYTASSVSATKTVSSPGTYYLTVKDAAGNLSDTYSVTFYETVLNAGSGSISPTSVLTKSGNSFVLPTPTLNNYRFLNWNTLQSGEGTRYTGTYTVTANRTLYAQYEILDTIAPTGSIQSTNDVTPNQTVSLEMADNKGVAGYYWGTSSEYASNPFTSSSGGVVTKTVSSAGTYYLVVKDTSGNLSQKSNITFYETVLQAGSGTVYPSRVLTKSGNSFNLPQPILSNYTFLNWNSREDGTGDAYKGSLTVTGNKTLYAQYKLNDITAPTGTISTTNNVSSFQTVTLTFSDDIGVAGYYWGTNDFYANNPYAATNGLRVEKEIREPGSYYLTVKDVSGNLSQTVSITLYRTQLKANGGTVSLSSVLTAAGKSFLLPTPERNGYYFKGWTGDESVNSGPFRTGYYTAERNTDLYAAWNLRPVLSALSYSFQNSYAGFGYPYPYYIPYERYAMIFGDTVKAKQKFKEQYIGDNKDKGWQGNCFGMSSSSGMLFQPENGIMPASFRSAASFPMDLSLQDKDVPNDLTLLSFIEAMQVSQYTDLIQQAFSDNTDLNELCEAVNHFQETGTDPVVIAVMQKIGNTYGGHALLGYKIEKESERKSRLYVYDSNYPNEERYITLATSNGRYTTWYYCVNDCIELGSAFNDCRISYVAYSDIQYVWENRGKQGGKCTFSVNTNVLIRDMDGIPIASIEDGVLYTGMDDIIQVVSFDLAAGQTAFAERPVSILLPADLYVVERLPESGASLQEEVPLQASMMHVEQQASIVTTADKVTFAVDDESGVNFVSIDSEDRGKTYDITLSSSMPGDHEQSRLKGSVLGSAMSFTQLGGTLNVLGANLGASLLVDGTEVDIDSLMDAATPMLSFSANGGTGTMPSRFSDNNGELVLPVCSFTPPEGKEFRTWRVNGTEYNPGEICKLTVDGTAIAVWRDADPSGFSLSNAAKTSDGVRVSIQNQRGGTAVLLLASYDSQGKMLNCAKKPVTVYKNIEETLLVSFDSKGGTEIRMFLVDSETYRPLTKSIIVT